MVSSKARLLIVMLIGLTAMAAKSNNKSNYGGLRPRAVFGTDDRVELYSTSAQWQEIGRSIAGKVSFENAQKVGSSWQLNGVPLNRKECPGGRFAEQITVPSCTGFLAKPNILITAAHCIKSELDCTDYYWVFEFALRNSGESSASYTNVEDNRVYKCKKILARKFANFGDVDYAVLELDRPVENRKPLQLGFNFPLTEGQALVNIGHSTGLPLKFKDSAKIIGFTPNGQAIDTDVDAFQGDSGSPVFDAETGTVLSITSHGHVDHYKEPGSTCRSVKVCKPGDKCHLSTSSKISNLKEDPIFKSLFE